MFSKSHTPSGSRPPSWSTLFPHLSSSPTPDPLPRYTPLPPTASPSTADFSPLPTIDEKAPSSPERNTRSRRWARRKVLVWVLLALGLGLVGMGGWAVMRGGVEGRVWDVRLPEWVEFDPPPAAPRVPSEKQKVVDDRPEMLDAIDDEWEEEEEGPTWSEWVKGPPTSEFRANLHRDVNYITGFIAAGWTNDVMSYANLILVGLLTSRIPILPPFAPSHLPKSAGFPAFSTVFDVQRLSDGIHSPVLEWHEVKNITETANQYGGGVKEYLGCWSVWMGSGEGFGNRAGYIPQDILNLDISYTPIPTSFRLNPSTDDPHVSLPALSHLSFPSGRSSALSQSRPVPSGQDGVVIEPDGELMCLDFMYYTGMERSFEWGLEWSAQWNLVGKHMRWSSFIESLARSYLKAHFGVSESDDVPPFISAHVRRGDFLNICRESTPGDGCMPSVKQLSTRVREVQHALSTRSSNPIDVSRVLITSDESSPLWWAEISALGYTYLNHTALGTAEAYGVWYEPWLDAVFQSLGTGFVGTDGSTMSLLAERRVKEWGGGEARRLWFGVRDEDLA